MAEDMTPDEHLAMAEELLRDPPKAGELVNSVYQRQVTALWHLGLAHLAAIRAGQAATPDGPRRLNGPMVARLRACAADTSSNWDGAVTVYPDEARQLVALIDALTDATPAADGQDGDGRG